MRLSTVLPVAAVFSALPISVAARPHSKGQPGLADFYALGCPNTTNPYASERERLDALNDFGMLLYTNHSVAAAYGFYAATNFINHAPEVPGDGTAIAIATQTPMLTAPGESTKILRSFAGSNSTLSEFGFIHFEGIAPGYGVGVIGQKSSLIPT